MRHIYDNTIDFHFSSSMTDAAFPICLPGISPTRAYFIQHGYVAKIESLKNKNSKLHKLVHELQKKAVAQGRQISQLEVS